MVPEGWKECEMGTFLTPTSREVERPKTAYLSLGLRNRGQGTFIKPINDPSKIKMEKLYLATKGDLIVNITFAWEGSISIIPPEHHDCYISHRFPTYRFKNESAYNDFFKYYYMQKSFVERLGVISPGGAGRNRVLNKKDFLKLKVLLPPLHEQKKIASILCSVDDAIQATQKVIDQTQKVKQGLLQELLTKGIGHTEFKKTEIGEIPVGWDVISLGDACNFINGRGFKPHEWQEEGLPIIRIQNLNGSTEYNYFKGEYARKLEVNNGDLLFAWSGSRGTSFGPHIWKGSLGLLNYHTWKIDITSGIDKGYLYNALQLLTKEVEDNAHGASALVHMQKAYIVDYKIPLPPQEEQVEISKQLESINLFLSRSTSEHQNMKLLKKGLMQDLLTGKVRVKV